MPDYDGIAEPPASAEEALLWIPRVLLSPLWLVSEFLLRRPLGTLLTHVERQSWHVALVQLFTWDGLRAGLVPIAFYDFGLLPSVGLYFFWNDLGARGHELRAHAAFGGVDWVRGALSDRVVLGEESELVVRFEALRRPDQPFQGFGPSSRASDRARYRRDQIGGSAELRIRPWRRSELAVALSLGWNAFDPDGYEPSNAERSLEDAVAQGVFAAPPPGLDGYLAYRQRVRIALDTREELPAPGHGVRLDLLMEQGVDLTSAVGRRWLRYAIGVAGFVDLGAERTVSLHARAMFVDPLGSEPVPFTEQVPLGGNVLDLPGFIRGALVDRSAFTATLRYRWPIWVYFDASLFFGAGNVFGEHLRDFDAELLRLSWGFGLQTIGDPNAGFRIALAFGTRPVGEGAEVESVRLALGGTLGF